MPYLSKECLVSAYEGFYKSTRSSFWGLLGILSVIKDKIVPGNVYEVRLNKFADFLNRHFSFAPQLESTTEGEWFIIFSKRWKEEIPENFYKNNHEKPNILEIAVWYYRDSFFNEVLTTAEIIQMFLADIGLSQEQARIFLDLNSSRALQFSNLKVRNGELLKALTSRISFDGDSRKSSISGEGAFIVALPSEIQRSPFSQTLYAGQKIQRCFLISKFPLDEYYSTFQRKHDPTGKIIEKSLNAPRELLPILAAIRTKPFILLAGISGTGKSRMVRQLARATCPDKLFTAGRPDNFEMIQVRPNWHDSTELLGYVSRVSGRPEFIVTDFVRFLARAWRRPDIPFFLCLDEMNLAPVEQYFAEYLSVIETRRREEGEVVTDVLAKFPPEVIGTVLESLFPDLPDGEEVPAYLTATVLRERFRALGGLPVPPNLVVMGTVNMDETTFSFSRKVLDRAMSFELNEVDMRAGLEGDPDQVGTLEPVAVTCRRLTGAEVWQDEPELGEKVVSYLEKLNGALERTPFKIAYRSRNEIMIYVAERTTDGTSLRTALDEATSMKILSRLEGDEQRFPEDWLGRFSQTVTGALDEVAPSTGEGDGASLSEAKLQEMAEQLQATGFASFWS